MIHISFFFCPVMDVILKQDVMKGNTDTVNLRSNCKDWQQRPAVFKTAQSTGGLCERQSEWNIIANNTVWGVFKSRKNKRKKNISMVQTRASCNDKNPK